MACCLRNGKFALISNLVGIGLMGDKFIKLTFPPFPACELAFFFKKHIIGSGISRER